MFETLTVNRKKSIQLSIFKESVTKPTLTVDNFVRKYDRHCTDSESENCRTEGGKRIENYFALFFNNLKKSRPGTSFCPNVALLATVPCA